MTIDILTMIPNFLQIVLLAVLLVLSVRMLRQSSRSLTAVFLVFVYALWLFTDLYWIIHGFMRPKLRMPFAVNEIGEAAVFLLMAALLSTVVINRFSSARKQALFATLFSVCNAALWIAWSGEWVQDILIGVAFTNFLCSIACSLKSQHRLSKKEWICLGFGCMLIVFAQGFTFFSDPQIKAIIETGAYILLVVGLAYWAYKLIAAHKKNASPKAVLSLVFALMGWAIMAKYMSDGIWYTGFMAAETIILLLLYLSVRKVVAKT